MPPAVVCLCIVTIACVLVAFAIFFRHSRTYHARRRAGKFFKECRSDRDGVPWYHIDHRFCHLTPLNAKKVLIELYSEFMMVSDARGLRPTLQAGGLIGWSYNGHMLPWDDDLDVFVFEDDVPKMLSLDGYRTSTMMIEVNPNHINRSEEEDPDNVIDARVISLTSGFFIDIVFLKKCKKDARYLTGKQKHDRFLASSTFPPSRATFEGVDVFVPADPIAYLIERYGKRVRDPTVGHGPPGNREWVFDGGWMNRVDFLHRQEGDGDGLVPRTIFLTYKSRDAVPPPVVEKLRKTNPAYDVRVFGDDECSSFLEEHWPAGYGAFFRKIPDGPIKADFWRACVVYTFGGVYLDADVDLKVPLDDFLDRAAVLCTSGSKTPGCVNPIILAAPRRSPVLKRCAELMYEMREQAYSYWGYSICKHLFTSLGELVPEYRCNEGGAYLTRDGQRVQMLQENQWSTRKGAKTSWRGSVVLQNHSPGYDNRKHAFV